MIISLSAPGSVDEDCSVGDNFLLFILHIYREVSILKGQGKGVVLTFIRNGNSPA